MPRKIWINIPAYTGAVHAETMSSLMGEIVTLAGRGDHVELHFECGSPYIADTRAIMVEKFLEGDADTFVFIDHDVSGWEAGRLVRLIDQPVDVRAGVYPYRRDPLDFPVRWDASKAELYADPETGLLEVWGVPGGFLVISRKCLEQMRYAYRHECDVAWGGCKRGAYCALFCDYWGEPGPAEGSRLKYGEDYAFCERWRAIGGRIWIDPEISFGHTGLKTFHGHIGEWLRNRTA